MCPYFILTQCKGTQRYRVIHPVLMARAIGPGCLEPGSCFFFIIRGANHANLYKNLIKFQISNVNLGTIGEPSPCPPPGYAPGHLCRVGGPGSTPACAAQWRTSTVPDLCPVVQSLRPDLVVQPESHLLVVLEVERHVQNGY